MFMDYQLWDRLNLKRSLVYQKTTKLKQFTITDRRAMIPQPLNAILWIFGMIQEQGIPFCFWVFITSNGQTSVQNINPANPPPIKYQDDPAYLLCFSCHLQRYLTEPQQVEKYIAVPNVYLTKVGKQPSYTRLIFPANIYYSKSVNDPFVIAPLVCLLIFIYSTGQKIKLTKNPIKAPDRKISLRFRASSGVFIYLGQQLSIIYFLQAQYPVNQIPIVKANPKNKLEDPRQNPNTPCS